MSADDPRIEQLLEELVDSHRTPEQVCADCPELLPQVRSLWRQLRRLDADLSNLFPMPGEARADEGELPQIQGYEVERILGRGGMGIVFRARHLRLKRPVALKMILAGPYANPDERKRFVQEAEAVASLHHPNIVEVHDAGEIDGRAYFTMELVEGGRLSQKVHGMPQPAREAAALVAAIADAVHAAHQKGIVHRDLTPSNILLASDGTPKVTDFGLALRLERGGGLTLSGTPVGTPSYMSPCQARGDKSAMGPTTDVWALGAILYELLTGRPPFRAESATATLQQVVADDPVPPARLNPRVPRDLQTICLKCLQKEPHKRYASAQALTEDLHRFERGEPILARAPGRVERLIMWGRRRPTAAALYATLSLAVLLLLSLVAVQLHVTGQRKATVRAAEQDLADADGLLQHSELPRARRALERAKGRVGNDAPVALKQRVAEQETIQNLLERLEAVRLNRAMAVGGYFRRRESNQEYEKAFDSAGFGLFNLTPKVIAERINRSPARTELIAALDDWAICAAQDAVRRTWLMSIARLADPDPWRDRVRDPLNFWDAAHIRDVAQSAPMQGQSLQILVGLGERLMHEDPSAAVPYLTRVQQQYPNDFYANFSLGRALEPNPMAMAYFQAAVALRPDAAAPHGYLGQIIKSQGHPWEALPYFERSLELDPQQPNVRWDLATALSALGRNGEAIVQYEEALRLYPGMSGNRNEYGIALQRVGQTDKAVEQFQEAIRAAPQATWPRYNLADALCKLGRPAQAVDQLRKLVAINPNDEPAQYRLAQLLIDEDRLEEARQAWQKAVENSPDDHAHWFGYAELCLYLGKTDEYRRNRLNLLVKFGDSKNPTVCERTAKACLLLPWETYELKLAAALADRAEAAEREGHDGSYPFDLFAQGLAAYRLGRFDDAIAIMSGKAAKVTPPCPKLITAMARFHKGERDQARQILSEAVRSFDWNQQVEPAGREEFWIAHILRREAESLIQPQPRDHAPSPPASEAPVGRNGGHLPANPQ